MTAYDLGDGVNFEHQVVDRDHVPTAATVQWTVTAPDGSTITPVVTSPVLGTYVAATFVADQLGPWTWARLVTGAVTDAAVGAFLVADPAPPAYAELPMVKAALGKFSADDRDELVEQAIFAASRQIDRRTGRRPGGFYPARAATARTVPVLGQSLCAGGDQVLLVDEIASDVGLAVATGGAGNWAAVGGWLAGPDNALADGRPYTELSALQGWLPASGRVQVTARWGWPAVPDEIVQATQLQACRLYRRKDSPQGVLGSSEWGTARVSRFDPDVEALIGPFILPAIA